MYFKAKQLTVTAFDDDTVAGLATACPCDGTWKVSHGFSGSKICL
jgi:hypothetical protein